VLVVIGGGEFGTYHARQLAKAVRAGTVNGPIAIVDRDEGCRAFAELGRSPFVRPVRAEWDAYLRRWLREASPDDHLVPAPLAPHLVWEWLAAELDAVPAPIPSGWGLPYELAPAGGSVAYLSAAAWRCPATCIEPEHCPALHAPRDWDLAAEIESRARAHGYRPAVFRCLHLAAGIASIPARALLDTRAGLRADPPSTPILVATSSHCHAAIGALRIPPPPSG
jgi:hypothetical protein